MLTEKQWLLTSDPASMLSLLNPNDARIWDVRLPDPTPSERKLRLFMIACCRSVWSQVTNPECIRTIETAEGYVEGQVTKEKLKESYEMSGTAVQIASWDTADMVCETGFPGQSLQICAEEMLWICDDQHANTLTGEQLTDLLRGIIGNPFRSVEVLPQWRTPDVMALAWAAYDNRIEEDGRLGPHRLALLSDALEEAGCPQEVMCQTCNGKGDQVHENRWGDNPEKRFYGVRCGTCKGKKLVPHPLMDHLRSPGPHWRGMWSLDRVLGLE